MAAITRASTSRTLPYTSFDRVRRSKSSPTARLESLARLSSSSIAARPHLGALPDTSGHRVESSPGRPRMTRARPSARETRFRAPDVAPQGRLARSSLAARRPISRRARGEPSDAWADRASLTNVPPTPTRPAGFVRVVFVARRILPSRRRRSSLSDDTSDACAIRSASTTRHRCAADPASRRIAACPLLGHPAARRGAPPTAIARAWALCSRCLLCSRVRCARAGPLAAHPRGSSSDPLA